MRAAAVLGVVIGLMLMAVVGVIFVSMRRAPAPISPARTVSDPRSTSSSNNIDPNLTPMAAADRQRADIDKLRLPLFHLLRDRYDKEIFRVAVLDDLETLDVVLYNPTNETIAKLVMEVVQPMSREYSIRRYRWYERTPRAADPIHNVAETTRTDDGHWNTFWK